MCVQKAFINNHASYPLKERIFGYLLIDCHGDKVQRFPDSNLLSAKTDITV